MRRQESERTPWSVVKSLEGEPGPELGSERPRQHAACGIDEANSLTEGGVLDHVVEVVAVIGRG